MSSINRKPFKPFDTIARKYQLLTYWGSPEDITPISEFECKFDIALVGRRLLIKHENQLGYTVYEW